MARLRVAGGIAPNTEDAKAMENFLISGSREKLCRAIDRSGDLTFVRLSGNIGDELIYAGARQLLRNFDYREVSIQEVQNLTGHTALLAGCGGWCKAFQAAPEYLEVLESRFERVIVLPSSFDPEVQRVRDVLSRTRALVFAREKRSYELVRDLCAVELACDTAFFFDFDPYRQSGSGTLNAFRTDGESRGFPLPPGNDDISLSCNSLDQWLWAIARKRVVRTDRAHVTIAAALLGKRVEYVPSSYHKVQAIVEYALDGFPVTRIPEPVGRGAPTSVGSQLADARSAVPGEEHSPKGHLEWLRWIEEVTQQVASVVDRRRSYIFLDGAQISWLPLPEREVFPFPEQDGQFAGEPADSAQAIRELERLRGLGARYLVVAWTAFWWLRHYEEFGSYVGSIYPQIVRNEKLAIYDLR